MTARLNRRQVESVRAKIQATQLINRLQAHIDGEIELSRTQVLSIKALLTVAMGSGRKGEGEQPASQVYVLHAVGTSRYKIGHAVNPFKRLKEVQTGCPFALSVVVLIDGGRKLEKRLHKKYAEFRVTGEWFELPDWAVSELVSLG